MLGMAASAAGAPDRICVDWTQRVGTDRASEDCMCANSVVSSIPDVGLTWVYGMPRNLNCCSTLV